MSQVISNMVMTTTDVEHSHFFAYSLKEYEIIVDIQDKKMQVRFIILLCTQGYNSLGDPTRQHNV